MTERSDIIISGAGIAGLIAAASMASRGYKVIVVDPSPAPKAENTDADDLRTTAYLRPARDLLEAAGVWGALEAHATPLRVLRVMDTIGTPPEIRASRDFISEDLNEEAFGWNVPNWRARAALSERLESAENVTLLYGVGFKSSVSRDRELIVRLSDGSQIVGRLLIGADGRGSRVRDAAGISAKTTRYGQMALACAVTHEVPHDDVSTEIYNTGGAFTLVPLRDHQGQSASAVVWMDNIEAVQHRLTLSEADLSAAMTERSAGILGQLSLTGGRNAWPVVTQSATKLTAHRTALIAEAAHVMPPIGAQGLNTSISDIRALMAALDRAPGDPGAEAVLNAFSRSRAFDLPARTAVIDLFNRVCKSGAAPIQNLRLNGLKLVYDTAGVRRAVMRAGLGE